MTEGSQVRPGSVALAAVLTGGVCWMALGWWRSRGGQVLEMPWLGLVPVLMAAALVVLSGWRVRRFVRSGRAAPPGVAVSPLQARGTVVAAQAAALAGGILTGWYAANAVQHLAALDVPSVQELFLRAAVSALAAVLLAGAGLLAQHWCRVPPEDDDGDGDEAEPHSWSPASG